MYYFRDLLLAQLAPDAGDSAGRIANPAELKRCLADFPASGYLLSLIY